MKNNDLLKSSDSTENNEIHLKLLKTGVFFGNDRENNVVFAVESVSGQVGRHKAITRKIVLEYNQPFTVLNDETREIKVMNLSVIKYIGTDRAESDAFKELCELYLLNKNITSLDSIYYIFDALVNLFNNKFDITNSEIQGCFGELITVLYFLNHGFDITEFRQKNEKMKFDFSITDVCKIETKSTVKEERVHHFRDEQLNSNIYDVLVCSVLLRRDDAGISLPELLEVLGKRNIDFDFMYNMKKIVYQSSNFQKNELRFNLKYSLSQIKFFNSKNLPKFNEKISSISKIEYDYDFSGITDILDVEVIEWMQNAGLKGTL
jgi:hypothetical protein